MTEDDHEFVIPLNIKNREKIISENSFSSESIDVENPLVFSVYSIYEKEILKAKIGIILINSINYFYHPLK
jgi:hypothetical protein